MRAGRSKPFVDSLRALAAQHARPSRYARPMTRLMLIARSLAVAVVLPLVACSATNPIELGTYTGNRAPLAGVRVAIAEDKRQVSFTPATGAPIPRAATAWSRERWPTLCPRGLKDTSSEVIDLGPEALEIGGVRVDHPLLVANCLHKPAVELMSLGADGAPTKPSVGELYR